MVAAGVMDEDERVELIGGGAGSDVSEGKPTRSRQERSRRSLDSRAPRREPPDPGNDLPSERGHLSRAGRRRLSSNRRPPGPDWGERSPRRRDRRFVVALRHGPQGGALRQLWRARTLGYRRG